MKKIIYALLLTSFAFATVAINAETELPRRTAENRPMPEKVREEIEKDKEKEEIERLKFEEENENIEDSDLDSKIGKSNGSKFPRTFSASQHWIAAKFQNPNTPSYCELELEDGSIWQISPGEVYITSNWLTTDDIVIVKSGNKTYPYSFKNLDTKKSVKARMLTTPYVSGIYTHEIIDINKSNGDMLLMDGLGYTTLINISTWDRSAIQYWVVGDIIVTGVNYDWIKWWNPYLLINADTLTHARGSVK